MKGESSLIFNSDFFIDSVFYNFVFYWILLKKSIFRLIVDLKNYACLKNYWFIAIIPVVKRDFSQNISVFMKLRFEMILSKYTCRTHAIISLSWLVS